MPGPNRRQPLLADVSWIWEYGGCYPRFLEQVVVKLLAKKDGGSRPIMLFRCLFRVHCKARKGIVTKWEKEVAAGKAFNNAPKDRRLHLQSSNEARSGIKARRYGKRDVPCA